MRKYRLVVALGALLALGRIGQPRAAGQTPGQTVLMSTVPFWNNGTKLHDPRWASSYVFLDRRTGDLVVSYPQDLGQQGAGPDDEPRITFGVRMPNHVEPFVAVRIRKLPNGWFEYTYRVRNGVLAAAPITEWWIGVGGVADLNLEPPPGWTAQPWVKYPLLWHWHGRGGNTMTDKQRIHFLWQPPVGPVTQAVGLAAVPPGGLVRGFTVVSPLRPGLVRAFFQGGGIVRGDDQPLPAPVAAQFAKATTMEMASRAAVTLGPKFSSYDNADDVALDYNWHIRGYTIHNHMLDPNSPFVSDALAAIQGEIEAAENSTVPPEQFVGPIPRIFHPPKGGLESLIYLGLRLSMGVPPIRSR